MDAKLVYRLKHQGGAAIPRSGADRLGGADGKGGRLRLMRELQAFPGRGEAAVPQHPALRRKVRADDASAQRRRVPGTYFHGGPNSRSNSRKAAALTAKMALPHLANEGLRLADRRGDQLPMRDEGRAPKAVLDRLGVARPRAGRAACSHMAAAFVRHQSGPPSLLTMPTTRPPRMYWTTTRCSGLPTRRRSSASSSDVAARLSATACAA